MCLILFASEPNERYTLVVAANRDEFYERPTVQAHEWQTSPPVIAGRDERAGGTWLGIDRSGRFAAVTNFREQPPDPIPPRSRGDLPLGFLTGTDSRQDYLSHISNRGDEYRGFNLLIADQQGCSYYGNRAGEPRVLRPGYYGLSNQLLDCDWPKVVEGRTRLQSILEEAPEDLPGALFDLLEFQGDERDFSGSFISSDIYGTRAATVVLVSRSGTVYFEERNFGPGGQALESRIFDFHLNCGADS